MESTEPFGRVSTLTSGCRLPSTFHQLPLAVRLLESDKCQYLATPWLSARAITHVTDYHNCGEMFVNPRSLGVHNLLRTDEKPKVPTKVDDLGGRFINTE